jgi:hypothetical protein
MSGARISRPGRTATFQWIIGASVLALATGILSMDARAAERHGAALQAAPVVQLSPSIGLPGGALKAKGKGFAPSSLVTADFDGTVTGPSGPARRGHSRSPLPCPPQPSRARTP